MNLESQVMFQLKEAMKAKDKIALEALRAIKSELLLAKTSGKDSLSEENEIALLQKLIKQRKEAAEQFKLNNRQELEKRELDQAEVIKKFLPKQLTNEELDDFLKNLIKEQQATSAVDIGKVMSVATKLLAGRAEGKLILETVKKHLH